MTIYVSFFLALVPNVLCNSIVCTGFVDALTQSTFSVKAAEIVKLSEKRLEAWP